MKVEILEQLEDGTQSRAATFEWRDGEIFCDNAGLWKNLMNSGGGVIIGARGKRYYPRDGVEYLRNLRFHFAGPYLVAGPLREQDASSTDAAEPSTASTSGIRTASDVMAAAGRSSRSASERSSADRSSSSESTASGRSPSSAAASASPASAVEGAAVRSASSARANASAASAATLDAQRATSREAIPAAPPAPPRSSATTSGSTSASQTSTSQTSTSQTSTGGPGTRGDGPTLTGEFTQLPPDALERVYSAVFRLSSALRGHALEVASHEADGLYQQLVELGRLPVAELQRAFESRDEYLEQRYQAASRTNYLRLWERLSKHSAHFISTLVAGNLPESLWPLFLMREALQTLQAHREEFRSSQGFGPLEGAPPTGTSAEAIERSCHHFGLPAFRQQGLSVSLLQELYAQAGEPFQRSIARFQQADFGQAELEARQALLIDPGHTEARLLLGDVLRRLDRLEEAQRELKHCIELEHLGLRVGTNTTFAPTPYLHMARARMSLGRAELSTGQVREAIAHLERALENLDQVARRTPSDAIGTREWNQLRQEQNTVHALLEPLYRALGETERADLHRRRSSFA